MRDKIRSMGADVIGSKPDELAAFMRAETAKWAKIVKEREYPRRVISAAASPEGRAGARCRLESGCGIR